MRRAGFVVVLSGRIDVTLTGTSGREILLYAVAPGQSCIQTTLGLLGDEAYTGEAVTAGPVEMVLIPRPLFLRLMDEDAGFRAFVLHAFGRRMADLTRVLEQVAFGRIDQRLAARSAGPRRRRRGHRDAGRSGSPHRLGPRSGVAQA